MGKGGRKGRREGRRDGRRERVGKDGLSKRGFKSHQVNESAKGKGGTKGNTSVDKERTVLDSDADSDSSVEPVAGHTPSAKGEPDARGKEEPKKAERKKRRYLLFIGNLRQTATQEEIVSHFERRGVCIAELRLLSHKDTGKSKGCGFMEFGSEKAMQNALKFHRSRVLGKCVNVEVTCGGGGRSENRRAKISEKNRTLRQNKARKKKPRT